MPFCPGCGIENPTTFRTCEGCCKAVCNPNCYIKHMDSTSGTCLTLAEGNKGKKLTPIVTFEKPKDLVN